MIIRIPTSTGELLDKISILEIKKSKIKNKLKLIEIRKEIKLLSKIVKDKRLNTSDLYSLKKQLTKINLRLWKVEDHLRKLEKNKLFKDNFINLARSVYKLNDKRANIKCLINDLTKSGIKEVKSYAKY